MKAAVDLKPTLTIIKTEKVDLELFPSPDMECADVPLLTPSSKEMMSQALKATFSGFTKEQQRLGIPKGILLIVGERTTKTGSLGKARLLSCSRQVWKKFILESRWVTMDEPRELWCLLFIFCSLSCTLANYACALGVPI